MVAFNLNSYIMTDKLKKDKAYDFMNLSIRPASETLKTLPHPFQLVCTNATNVQEIDLSFDHRQISYSFTHLNQVNNIQLNTIIDVQVQVVRDFGISTGMKNENIWTRRDLHVSQVLIGSFFDRNMAGLKIKLNNVKVSWFDGSRVLISMGNTQLSVV
ncbi:unnamed protein product [Rotaria magnacalcarata]|uniref:Uncharacterized protein n=2 Tax=Rotaria magnacalcarata TaxID=392030 RepID=A0A8S2KHS0_9BILA|nr:unnamed protein product [Rotaria magnacalcarata]CAF4060126.1 unnamed protein product [Rotaria magnacalcarata]